MARRVKISELPVLTEITPGDVIIVNDENVVTSGITVPNFITSIFSYDIPFTGTLDFTGGGVKGLNLDSLDDVVVGAYDPKNGQALVYDAGLHQWVPGTALAGGGGGSVTDVDTIIDGGNAGPDSGLIINGPGGGGTGGSITTADINLTSPTRTVFAEDRVGLPPSSGLTTQEDANIWFYHSIIALNDEVDLINNNGTGPNIAFETTAPLTVTDYTTNVKNYVHGMDIRTLNSL